MISLGLILGVYIGEFCPVCGAVCLVVFSGAAYAICRTVR